MIGIKNTFKMRVFITGSSGFIGSHLIHLLIEKKIPILCLNRSEVFYKHENILNIKGDLNNIDDLFPQIKAFNPTHIIHLAWEGIPDFSEEMSNKNLFLSKKVIDLAYKLNCKNIFCAGSCWEYGQFNGNLSENLELKPYNYFSDAKKKITEYGLEISNKYNFNFIWGRIFYVYGPKQREKSLIPSIINSIYNNELPQINNPFNKNDFIFINDVIDLIYQLTFQYDKTGIFNIGSGYSTSVLEIVEKVIKLSNKNLSFNTVKNIDNSQNFYANIDKVSSELSWKPKFDIEKGLAETIKFYNSFKRL